MERFKNWAKSLSRADIALIIFALIFGAWVALREVETVSKKKVDGVELSTVVVEEKEYKIERAYSTSKNINIELTNGDVVVLTDYYITKEGVVRQIK